MATLSKFLLERLATHGVGHIFMVPGDYSVQFCDAVCKSPIKAINSTSELCAAYSADAYARLSGLGCVSLTYGVGALSAINAVAGAFAEKSPVVVISGSPGVGERNSKFMLHHAVGNKHDSQLQMFKHITCHAAVLDDPDTMGFEIDSAIKSAKTFKRPVYLEMPRDLVGHSLRYDPYSRGTPKVPTSDPIILAEALKEVTGRIQAACRPVIWAGVEVARFGFGKKLMQWAEYNKIPVATSILGKGTVSEDHELALGVYCEAIASQDLKDYMNNSDCVLMVGVMQTDMNLGFTQSRFKRDGVISIGTDVLHVSNHNYPEVFFSEFVEALCKVRFPRASPQIPKREKLTDPPCDRLSMQGVVAEINKILTPKSVIVSDIGDSLFGALDLKVRDTNGFLSNAFYTSMGFSIPAAVAVACALPQTRPIVLVGDGAFQMTGQEFSTLVGLSNSAIVFLIDNGGYTTERLILDGPFNNVRPWDYAKIISGYGGIGYVVTTPTELREAIASCEKLSGIPALVHVRLPQGDCSPALKRLFSKKQ